VRGNRRQRIHDNLKRHDQRRQGQHPGHSSLLEMPSTPAEARHQGAREAQLEYNPVIRQIKGGIRGSQQRERDISSWYRQADETIAQSAAASAAAQTAANAALAAQANGAAGSSLQNQAAIAGQNADFAKLTGADPSAFAQGTQTAAAAANQRQLTSAALAAPIINSGVTQAGYFGAQRGNTSRDAIYQHLQEGNRRQTMKQDLLAAKKERAAKSVANFGTIKQTAIDNRLKRQAFQLEGQEAEQKAQNDAIDNSIAQQNARTSARNARTSEESAQETRRHDKASEGGKGGLTPSERHDQKEAWNNAKASALSLYNTGWYHKNKHGKYVYSHWKNWDQLAQAVAEESQVSPAMARRAVKRLVERVKREERKHQPPPNISLPSPFG
jgi:hypothetical protein